MIRPKTLVTVVLAGLLSAATVKSQQAPKKSDADSERQAIQEAIRFEKAKVAAANAQAEKDAGVKPAKTQAAETKAAPKAEPKKEPKTEAKPARSQAQSDAVSEAVRFERAKVAAAEAEQRKQTARAENEQPRRAYSRR